MFTALFGRKWGTPFWKVNGPFIIGGAITIALINNLQDKMVAGEKGKKDSHADDKHTVL